MRGRCLRCWLHSLQLLYVPPLLTQFVFSDTCAKVYMALHHYVNNSESSWNYNNSTVAEVYSGHLEELGRIKSKKPTSYHAILRKFFLNCVYVSPPFSV
jgi:hypothetical protein